MGADENAAESVYIDPDDLPDIELVSINEKSAPGLAKLADLGIVEFDTETRNGREVITDCRINVRYLSTMATEFHVVERRYGDRWEFGSWDPEIRILD